MGGFLMTYHLRALEEFGVASPNLFLGEKRKWNVRYYYSNIK